MGHFSDYLNQHPRTTGMSAGEFSRQVGIGKNTANEILKGRTIPHDATLVKISNAFAELSLAKMRELVLLDTPFELPDGAKLLDLEQRNLIKEIVNQFLKASGKSDRVPQAKEQPPERAAGDNVVELQRPTRVRKAAYDPPKEE